jgi:hypothetical protein
VEASGAGFVTRFEIDTKYLSQFTRYVLGYVDGRTASHDYGRNDLSFG